MWKSTNLPKFAPLNGDGYRKIRYSRGKRSIHRWWFVKGNGGGGGGGVEMGGKEVGRDVSMREGERRDGEMGVTIHGYEYGKKT